MKFSPEKFKNWLANHGAVVLDPTNPWEVVRFRTAGGVSVIYTNKHGNLTFTGESSDAYKAFTTSKPWKAVDRKRQSLKALKAKIATRDGKKCFACQVIMPLEELTVEHLLSFAHGGTDNYNNLALFCKPDNTAVGSMSVTNKIEFIIQRRAGVPLMAELGEVQEFTLTDPKSFVRPLKKGEVVKLESTPEGENFFHRIFRHKDV